MATAPRAEPTRRTGQTLHRELAYYRELFEEGPEPYLVTDVNAVVVEANDAAAALFGIPRHRLRGKPLAGLVARDDRATFRAAVVAAVRAGELSEWEARVIPRAGPEVHVSVVARPRRTPGGAIDSLLVMFRDVTVRRAIELEVRTLNAELEWRVADRTAELAEANRRNERLLVQEKRARRHLAALLDRLEHGVVLVDRALCVEFANRAAADLLGNAREGAPLPEPFRDFSLRQLAADLFERDDAVSEVAIAGPRGDRVYALGGIPAGGSSTVVLLVSDVSERERRERAQRDFITNAAHELQTPLTAIASATEVLQSGAKDVPEQRDRFLAHIEAAAARLARLTRGLLVLARAQALGENPRFERVDVADVLEAVRRDFAVRGRVRIDVSCEEGTFVAATRELLEQAVGELVTNALKHTEGGAISLAAAPTSADGDRVALTVSDRGSGFAPSEAERVLDRFYRADDGAGQGFGLGLSIVRQIAVALGGDVKIDSAPGKGTTARMILRSVGTPAA